MFIKSINTRREIIIMYNETTDLITIEDMCNILLIGRNSAYKLLKSQKIKAFKIGKVWKIPMSAVDEFILSESRLSKNRIFYRL